MGAGLLRLGAEDRVAATHVGEDGVGAATIVPHRHLVVFARTAAIAITGPGGQKAAEDAMFGVEDREVLIADRLDGRAADLPGELTNPFAVQIVGRGDANESQVEKLLRADGVSRI